MGPQATPQIKNKHNINIHINVSVLGLEASGPLSCPVPGRVPGSCSVPALFQAEFLASKAFLQRPWQRPWLLRRFRSWGLDSVPHFPALFQAEFLAHAALFQAQLCVFGEQFYVSRKQLCVSRMFQYVWGAILCVLRAIQCVWRRNVRLRNGQEDFQAETT